MYRVGQVAKQYGISADTLRYYDQLDLVSPSQRSGAGYRLYSDSDLKVLDFVLHAKGVGFTLEDTRELLSLSLNKQSASCHDVKSFTAIKLTELAAKIAELQKMQLALQKLHDACCGGEETAEHCTILQALESE